VPRHHGHVVNPDRIDDDPHDRENAEGRTLGGGAQGLPRGHVIDEDCYREGNGEGDEPSPLRLHLERAEEHEDRQQRKHGENRGQAQ
jgi:hypothetical protein